MAIWLSSTVFLVRSGGSNLILEDGQRWLGDDDPADLSGAIGGHHADGTTTTTTVAFVVVVVMPDALARLGQWNCVLGEIPKPLVRNGLAPPTTRWLLRAALGPQRRREAVIRPEVEKRVQQANG